MFYFFLLFLIFSIVIAILMTSIIIGLIMTRGVPFISTPKKDFDAILEATNIKSGETICDLGCGRAHFLVRAAKKFGAKGVGYELSLWPYLWAKFNIWQSSANVKVLMKNFFQADLSDIDVVFCYLFPEVMEKLELKFKKELKLGARVVSYGFNLPNRSPNKTIITNDDNVELGRIFVYQY